MSLMSLISLFSLFPATSGVAKGVYCQLQAELHEGPMYAYVAAIWKSFYPEHMQKEMNNRAEIINLHCINVCATLPNGEEETTNNGGLRPPPTKYFEKEAKNPMTRVRSTDNLHHPKPLMITCGSTIAAAEEKGWIISDVERSRITFGPQTLSDVFNTTLDDTRISGGDENTDTKQGRFFFVVGTVGCFSSVFCDSFGTVVVSNKINSCFI